MLDVRFDVLREGCPVVAGGPLRGPPVSRRVKGI